MRVYVDPAATAVHAHIDRLNNFLRQIVLDEADADALPQGAGKAGRHQDIQRGFGDFLCKEASELNRIGARMKAKA